VKSIRNLRIIGILEGISYLVLLCIAMPLKYVWDMPLMVKYTGWAHGLLFILYIVAVPLAKRAMNWNVLWVFIAWAASLIPFGTFILDRHLVKREKEVMMQQKA
jgi:integral membrane protein